jgi:hypothetical protein
VNPGAVVLSGGLWFAVPIAIAAGLLSFLSPCVLPLVPGYLGYVSGVTSGRERTRSRMLLGVALFIAGFSVVFLAVSLLVGTVGVFVTQYTDVILRIAGADQARAGLPSGLDGALQEADLADEDDAHQDHDDARDPQNHVGVLGHEDPDRADQQGDREKDH